MQPVAAHATGAGVPSDTILVRQASRGDARAFDAIASARIAEAYRLASAILGDAAEAADATQDALVAAWRELPRLRDPERFDAWFHRILVNECRMTIRRQERVKEARPVSADDDRLADLVHPRGVEALETVETTSLLEAAFQQLDADDRAIIVLHHLQDRPVAEIAEIVHLPAGTVKWRLHEARAALVSALEALA